MTERPILFSAPMVRAILAGTKTQTRRVWKMPRGCEWYGELGGEREGWFVDPGQPWWLHVSECRCPYGREGDVLWAREAFGVPPDCEVGHEKFTRLKLTPGAKERPTIHYRADASERAWVERWRPSIHMPRWASRITLEVTGVRVERLHGISEADALAEGIRKQQVGRWYSIAGLDGAGTTARAAYALLWNKINGPGSWDANPWVWVVEFQRIDAAQQS